VPTRVVVRLLPVSRARAESTLIEDHERRVSIKVTFVVHWWMYGRRLCRLSFDVPCRHCRAWKNRGRFRHCYLWYTGYGSIEPACFVNAVKADTHRVLASPILSRMHDVKLISNDRKMLMLYRSILWCHVYVCDLLNRNNYRDWY